MAFLSSSTQGNAFPAVNGTGSTIVAGTPVYSVAAGSVAPAAATSAATALVVGFMVADCAPGATGTVQSDGVAYLQTWSLSFGVPYYLSATAGAITTTAPTTIGQFVTLLGVALSTTQLRLLIQPPVGL